MQASQSHRVAEQGQAGIEVQPFRPNLHRLGHALCTQRFDRRRLTMTGSGHGTSQGVLPWVDHGPHEAVMQGMPAVLVGVPVGGQQLLRGSVFLGNEEQLLVFGCQAQARTAGNHRNRDRQHQRANDRRQPPQEARVQPRHQPSPGNTQQGLRTMAAHSLAPRGGVVVTLGRIPGRGPAEERGQHEAGVEDHAYRCQQHGEQHLHQHRQGDLDPPAELDSTFGPDQDDTEQLGQEQQHDGGGEQRHGLLRVPLRPQRVQLVRLDEVLRLHQGVGRQQRSRQHQEQEPQRRRQVRHHPGEEHRTVHRVHALDQEQAEVHQVAVAPAAVALELVQQVWRQLFIAARQVVGDPHAPAGTAHQRGFDEVVRKDCTGERALARQRRQGAVLDERLHADDRVMAPVVRLAQLPEVQAGGEQRAVHAGGELLHARIQGIHARGFRPGLDDAGVRVGLHQAHQAAQALAAHDAVGVEHDHVLVLATPTTAEVVEVAALALHPAPTAAVEDAAKAFGFAAHVQPGLLFSHGDVGVVGVAEHEEVETVEVAAGGHRLERCTQAGEHARHVFVTDRHDQCGTRLGCNRLVAGAAARNLVLVAPGEQLEEAHERSPEARRHPAEQDAEEDQDGGLQGIRPHLHHRIPQRLVEDFVEVDERPALVRQNALHVPAGDDGLADHQGQQDVAADRADRAPARRRQLALGWLRGIGAAGHAPPHADQHVGAPRLWHHFGALDRRGDFQTQAAAAVDTEHFGVFQLGGAAHGQARAHRGLHGLGSVGGRFGRQTLVQLTERRAIGEVRPLLVTQW